MKKRPHFEMRLAKSAETYFVLVAPNGEVICTSQMYENEENCRVGIASVKWNAPLARILDVRYQKS